MNSTDLYALSKDVLILLISKIQEQTRQEVEQDMQIKLDKVKKELDTWKLVYDAPTKQFCYAENCEHYELTGDKTFTSTNEYYFDGCRDCGSIFCKYHTDEYLINNQCRHH